MPEKRCEPRKLAGSARGRLQDEVYRQMSRVEARIPEADLDLAMTLVNAWLAVETDTVNSELRKWLRVVSPLSMQMIEALRCQRSVRQDWLN